MASIKLKFRPSAVSEKEGTLYFQLIHRRSTRLVYTGYHIQSREWDERISSIHIVGTPERQAQLQLIAARLRWEGRRITALVREKELTLVEYTVDDIVSEYRKLPVCQICSAIYMVYVSSG